ncbi:hypothetical protein SHKM778_87630 [Streptomyces sp. KM77-8]|uniref:DEAD/DEAH box helicase n=1 Tax=Streptomyces haneummycinicus TaxID=3074435 RepID=A0AAT9HXJ0_9ACTN
MNRSHTNDRFARTRNGSTATGKNGKRFGSSSPSRSGGPARAKGHSRRTGAPQGEFALPKTITPPLPEASSFADLAMPSELLAALGSQGVTALFPIQAATLPNSLAGRDVLGRGRTGSGKTLAFGLALLARTAGQRAEARQPLGLILVPTRELAQQVTDALTPYAHSVKLRLATVVGGMSISRQAGALRRGVEIVVATPDVSRTSSNAATAGWTRSGSPSSTRRTRWPTWASCRRSPPCSTRFAPTVSACCSPPLSTATSTCWYAAT